MILLHNPCEPDSPTSYGLALEYVCYRGDYGPCCVLVDCAHLSSLLQPSTLPARGSVMSVPRRRVATVCLRMLMCAIDVYPQVRGYTISTVTIIHLVAYSLSIEAVRSRHERPSLLLSTGIMRSTTPQRVFPPEKKGLLTACTHPGIEQESLAMDHGSRTCDMREGLHATLTRADVMFRSLGARFSIAKVGSCIPESTNS
jgi:hypothetical protein